MLASLHEANLRLVASFLTYSKKTAYIRDLRLLWYLPQFGFMADELLLILAYWL